MSLCERCNRKPATGQTGFDGEVYETCDRCNKELRHKENQRKLAMVK